MNFSQFAQKLASVIRTDTVSAYTRNLFDVALSEKDYSKLDDFTNRDFMNFYYGRTSIVKIKNSIAPFMRFELFENFISGLDLPTRKRLCEIFGSTPAMVGERISRIFSQIMSGGGTIQMLMMSGLV